MLQTLTCLVLLTACASATTVAREPRANPAPEPPASRVRFMDSSGLLGCAWNEAEFAIEQAMLHLGPALSQCADDERTSHATWTLWVDVSPSGEVERAWVPNADQVATADAHARPPACATAALQGRRLESGPPACGSVLMLRFEVSGDVR